MSEIPYDTLLVVGFGGPEGPDDILPFLENVTRGRNIPRERLVEVAEHYHHVGGRSPLNDQVRALIAALEPELSRRGIALPIAWGNRNWHPYLTDTMSALAKGGSRRALALVLSPYSSYSSCRQYLDDIERARASVGSAAPPVDKIRAFYNHPDFVAANVDRMRDAWDRIPADHRKHAHVAFTAHSIPSSMAATCRYEEQLGETCRLICEELGIVKDNYRLVYQSRSGRPSDPWLGPDINDHLSELATKGAKDIVIMPVGFLSDHVEVVYDLDHEAAETSQRLGLSMIRAPTVGTHPRFVSMIGELVEERLGRVRERRAIGRFGPSHDVCQPDCCAYSPGRPAGSGAQPNR